MIPMMDTFMGFWRGEKEELLLSSVLFMSLCRQGTVTELDANIHKDMK